MGGSKGKEVKCISKKRDTSEMCFLRQLKCILGKLCTIFVHKPLNQIYYILTLKLLILNFNPKFNVLVIIRFIY